MLPPGLRYVNTFAEHFHRSYRDRIKTSLTYLLFVCLSVLRVRDHTETLEFVSQGRQGEKRIKNTQDPEIAHEQLNCSDTNENSLSDKSRRANCLKERNQMNNNPAEDL